MTLRKAPLALLLGLLFLSIVAQATPAPRIGDQVPEINLPARDGSHYSLSELQGNYVLVNFWATWCVGCNLVKNPEYKSIYSKYKNTTFKDASGFTIFSVAFDANVEKWERKIAEQKLEWPFHVIDRLNHDSPFWNIFQIRTLPANILLNARGEIVAQNISAVQLDIMLEKQQTGFRPQPVMPAPKPVVPTIAHNPRWTTPPRPSSPQSHNPTIPQSHNPHGHLQPTNNQQTVYKVQIAVHRDQASMGKYQHLGDLGSLEWESVPRNRLGIDVGRVQLGSYDKGQADAVLQAVKQRGYKEAFLVKRKGVVTHTQAIKPTYTQAVKPTITPPTKSAYTQPVKPTITPPKKFAYTEAVKPEQNTPSYQPMSNTVPKANTRIAPSPPPTQIRYKIQLGAFQRPNMSAFKHLQDLGALQQEIVPGRNLKRVLLGNYSLQEANRILDVVKRRGISNAYVVKKEVSEVPQSNREVISSNTWSSSRSTTNNAYPGKTTRKSMINRSAPGIILEASRGKEHPLYSMRNKVTLVYFWSPVSGETMDHHLELNRIYHLFKKEKFEIYGVAFDKDRQRVRTILDRDQVHWNIHLIDTNGLDSDILRRYQVEYLPALFLVDESGVIIAENLSYEKAEELLRSHFTKKK